MAVMMSSIREAAEDLVRVNIEAEPAIIKAYLFPSDQEIRLVYVDPTTSPLRSEERIAPFYFGASKQTASPFASCAVAVALVLPEEEGHVRLPKGWGDWIDGDVVWEASTP